MTQDLEDSKSIQERFDCKPSRLSNACSTKEFENNQLGHEYEPGKGETGRQTPEQGLEIFEIEHVEAVYRIGLPRRIQVPELRRIEASELNSS